MQKFFSPGSMVCDAVGLAGDIDHCAILRMFVNTMVWGAFGVAAALILFA